MSDENIHGMALKKGGFFVKVWDGDANEERVRPLVSSEYWQVARKGLEVDDDVSFRDFWLGVEALGPDLRNTLGDVTQCDVDDFLAEAKLEPVVSEGVNSVHYLIVEKTVTAWETRPFLENRVDFGAYGLVNDPLAPAEVGTLSVSFAPMNELTSLPFRVNKEVHLIRVRKGYTQELLGVYRCELSLHDVICAVLWEISFYGSPRDRSNTKTQLIGNLDRIQGALSTPLETLQKHEPTDS